MSLHVALTAQLIYIQSCFLDAIAPYLVGYMAWELDVAFLLHVLLSVKGEGVLIVTIRRQGI